MAEPPPTTPPAHEHRTRLTTAQRKERVRLAAALIIGAVVTAFALLNLNDVKVHWLFATGRSPLILVIVVAFVLGVIGDRLLIVRGRRRRRDGS